MVLIAQIALGVIIGGVALALLATGFIMWMQPRKNGKKRLALNLFIAGVVILVMLIAVVVAQ
jgi:hypothetical protein